MGFIADLIEIYKYLVKFQKNKENFEEGFQIQLYSATINNEVEKLIIIFYKKY
jgi:hypothetical protein